MFRDCFEREEPHGLRSFTMDRSEQHDERRQQEQRQQHQPQAGTCRLPDDVVEQILCLLPVEQILLCGRTCRAFSRAALVALQGATWAPDPAVAVGYVDGAVRCGTHGHTHCCRIGGDSGTHTDSLVVGTPCLDLRTAADAVDCRALSVMLRRGFGKLEESSSADGGGDVAGTNDKNVGASATRERKCILRGLAVCSAAVKDQVRCCYSGVGCVGDNRCCGVFLKQLKPGGGIFQMSDMKVDRRKPFKKSALKQTFLFTL